MFTITTQTATGCVQSFNYDTYKAAHVAARNLAKNASRTTLITLRDALGKLTVNY